MRFVPNVRPPAAHFPRQYFTANRDKFRRGTTLRGAASILIPNLIFLIKARSREFYFTLSRTNTGLYQSHIFLSAWYQSVYRNSTRSLAARISFSLRVPLVTRSLTFLFLVLNRSFREFLERRMTRQRHRRFCRKLDPVRTRLCMRGNASCTLPRRRISQRRRFHVLFRRSNSIRLNAKENKCHGRLTVRLQLQLNGRSNSRRESATSDREGMLANVKKKKKKKNRRSTKSKNDLKRKRTCFSQFVSSSAIRRDD